MNPTARPALIALALAANLALLVATSPPPTFFLSDAVALGPVALSADDDPLAIDGTLTVSRSVARNATVQLTLSLQGDSLQPASLQLQLFSLDAPYDGADPATLDLGAPIDAVVVDGALGGVPIEVAAQLTMPVDHSGTEPFHLLLIANGDGAIEAEATLTASAGGDDDEAPPGAVLSLEVP